MITLSSGLNPALELVDMKRKYTFFVSSKSQIQYLLIYFFIPFQIKIGWGSTDE